MKFIKTRKLTKIIKKLKKLDYSGWSEEKAKIVTVVKILEVLGWLPLDMKFELQVEKIGGGGKLRIDILLGEDLDENQVLIECKKPDIKLSRDDNFNQLMTYAFEHQAAFAVLTNGFEWHLYLPAIRGVKARNTRYACIELEGPESPRKIATELSRFLAYKNFKQDKAWEDAQSLPMNWQKLIKKPPYRFAKFIKKEVKSNFYRKPSKREIRDFLVTGKINTDKYYAESLTKRFTEVWSDLCYDPPPRLIKIIRCEIKNLSDFKPTIQQVRKFLNLQI